MGYGGGELGGFDSKDLNSNKNRVYTPSLSLIPLKMWPQPTYPQNLAPPGEGGYNLGVVVASFLKLLSSNLVCKPYLGLNLNLWSEIP